jgi:Big-like domain-containing protein
MRRSTELGRGVARVAALAAVLAWTLASPPPASAQLVGSLIVTITSPTSGSTVGGTIPVTATVSIVGTLTVQRVQFQLDGSDLGTSDTSAPYSVSWNTFPAANGSHTLRAVAQDMLGIWYPSQPVTVTVFNDHTPPTVAIASPASGATVTGNVTVSATASDNVGVVGVQFQLDGGNLGAEDTAAPYSVTWNSATASIGTHTLTATARDAAGNAATSAAVTVTVPDTTPPTVSITSPAPGATVSGVVSIAAAASDNVGVAGVRFQVDGAAIGAEDTMAPYAASWDSSGATPGNHTLTAIARDAANNSTTSAAVTVNVRDVLPPNVAVTSPASGATVTGAVNVAATATDNGGVAGVQFQLDGAALGAEDTSAPYAVTWDTTTAADGGHSLSAVARDQAGNTTTSASVAVSVSNDRTPPTVSITAPSAGATVAGVVTVTASATDNVGVAGVQFKLDGNNLGAEDTTAPYSVSWDTSTATGGPHTLTAVARDAANNTATSASVSVTVSTNAFAPGDVFVALLGGTIEWHNADGSFRQNLPAYGNGQISSLAFDPAGYLYAPNWYGTIMPPGNTVARFDPSGNLLGSFGTGYNANPGSVTFDAQGNVYVGQSEGTGDILKFDSTGALLASFDVAVGNKGTDHIDLGADGCTMFYTSRTHDVYRYDVCTNTQLPYFNTQPLPGYEAYHIRVLPDGGVLVADTAWVVRLDGSGNQIQTYFAPGENNYWGGVDLVGDGTFWASNAATSNIYHFDLQSGAILGSFHAGTSASAAGLGVKPITH